MLLSHGIKYYFIVNVHYGTAGAFRLTQGSGPVLVGYFSCSGDEANLLECTPNYRSTNSYCQNNHYYDAAVICES